MKCLTYGRVLCMTALISGIATASTARAAIVNVNVRIENLAPTGGVAITPVWAGFHSGNFDSYNSGAAAGRVVTGLERLAEDGNTAVISSDFLGGFTYVDAAGLNSRIAATGSTAGRVDQTIGGAPIQAGESVNGMFALDDGGANNFFSYASMVLPSNDYFLGNGDPNAFDLTALLAGGGPVTFLIGTPTTINDAGTEAQDFATSAGNPLFGLPTGQTGPNQGADDPSAFVRNVTGDPYAGFANIPGGADLTPLNFNNSALYSSGGIARITISAVPEPSGLAALVFGLGAIGFRRKR